MRIFERGTDCATPTGITAYATMQAGHGVDAFQRAPQRFVRTDTRPTAFDNLLTTR